MMLETKRLFIKPLSAEQLLMYIRNDHSLERELALNETARGISPALAEALEQTILPNVKKAGNNYLYATLWTLILKSQNKMVGDLCFVGEPNEAGEIEIGYGTYESFQGNGYMTEAVGAMITWAEQQPEVRCLVAATEKANIASFTILKKNNFVKVGETETMYNWRLQVK